MGVIAIVIMEICTAMTASQRTFHIASGVKIMNHVMISEPPIIMGMRFMCVDLVWITTLFIVIGVTIIITRKT